MIMAYFCKHTCPWKDCEFKVENTDITQLPKDEPINFYDLASACPRFRDLGAHQVNMLNPRYREKYEREVRNGLREPFPG